MSTFGDTTQTQDQPPTQDRAGQPGRPPLRRAVDGRMVAGVCAGLADYFDVDVTIVRVCWLLAFLLGGTGLLAYIILWIALPLAPTGATYAPAPVAPVTSQPVPR